MNTLNMEKSFGGIERVQQQTDVLIGSFAGIESTPENYNTEIIGTGIIENQNQTPSCGAHAGASLKNTLEDGFRGSPEYLWKAMRLVDKLSPDDGSNMLTIMERLSNRGICPFNDMPNNSLVSNAEYADPSTLTSQMDKDAHRIGTYGFTFNPTFQQIKDAIYQHKAVILLLRVGAEFWTAENGIASWQEKDILPLDPNRAQITSGHFVTAKAFDKDFIYFQNEWSDSWGKKGWGYFGEDYAYRVAEMGSQIHENAKYIFTKVLRFGMKSFDVAQLQKVLNSQGSTLLVDGQFGNKTMIAVQLFQTKHGLVSDGIVGNKTNAVLNSL